jgi:hypothetical protein
MRRISNGRSKTMAMTLGVAMAVWAAEPAAQPAGQAPPSAAPSATAARPAIEPEAMTALRKMGEYLRSLPAFAVRAQTSIDEVLESGQKIQLDGDVELRVRKPDRLRADVVSERKHRTLYYDGRTVTLYAPRVKYYAAVSAPPTIREALGGVARKYGIEVPLADLFFWGTDLAPTDDITRAMHIGPSRVDGTDCDQYAFRQADVDWQVWIQKGPNPVPRKLVITTTQDPAQPQSMSQFRWDLAPAFDDTVFSFVAPADAQRIVIYEAGTGPVLPK